MKKKIISIALVVAMIAIIAAGSFAYFTDTKSTDNVFTVGNVKIKLTEPNWENQGKIDAETVYAGEALAKDPTVENTGKNPCFVRVKVEGLGQFGEGKMITYESGSNYTPNNMNDGWEYYNGYFYWTKPLVVVGTENESWNAGLASKTAPLFDRVRMPVGLTGDEEVQPIVVTAEAVQAQGAMPSWSNTVGDQPAVKDMSVEQIAAWFTTCGM